MEESERPGMNYSVSMPKAVAAQLKALHRKAARQNRGEQVLAAFKSIVERLGKNPRNVGEPLYQLSSLQLIVRTCAVRPLVVDFAVHEGQRIVFIKGVRLLSQ